MGHHRAGNMEESAKSGLAVAAIGVLWEAMDVAHRLSYVADVAHRMDWRTVVYYIWHPSAVTLIAVGLLWIGLCQHLKNRRQAAVVEPGEGNGSREVTTFELPPNIRDLVNTLPDGASIEIRDVQTRTIKVSNAKR